MAQKSIWSSLEKLSKSYRTQRENIIPPAKEEVLQREKRLSLLEGELKQDFAGLDQGIEEIIQIMKPWYLFPEAQRRPVLINLWGMTGVGKTSLVLEIVKRLGFGKYFSHQDLNQWAGDKNESVFKSIHPFLAGRPSILLFDDLHNLPNLDEFGRAIERGAVQQIWSLFDSGKVSKSVDSLESMITTLKTERSRIPEESVATLSGFDDFFLNRYIMDLELYTTPQELLAMGQQNPKQFFDWLIKEYEWHMEHSMYLDFSKSVIFTSGNVDEVYVDSFSVNPDDISADELYSKTKQVSADIIKLHLLQKFRPEQVARLGGFHIVFPSISRKSFLKIISNELANISEWAQNHAQLEVSFDGRIAELVFQQGAVAAQGARSVLSFMRMTIEPKLTNWIVIAIKDGIKEFEVSFDREKYCFLLMSQGGGVFYQDPVETREDKLPEVILPQALKEVLAIHEAGHCVAGIVNEGRLPLKILVGPLAWHRRGPRVVFPNRQLLSLKSARLHLETLLAGAVAERLMFGKENVSLGSIQDLTEATALTQDLIQKCGFGHHVYMSFIETNQARNIFNDCDEKLAESWLTAAEKNAVTKLKKQWPLLLALTKALLQSQRLTINEIGKLVEQHYVGSKEEIQSILTNKEPQADREYSLKLNEELKKAS